MRANSADSADCRCVCGSLSARILPQGVQLKCRRCRRILIVPWTARSRGVRPIPAVAPFSSEQSPGPAHGGHG